MFVLVFVFLRVTLTEIFLCIAKAKSIGYIVVCIYYRLERGAYMSKKNVIVSNVSKGHANPIAELVQVACKFDSEITLENNNRRINAKSIMGIMAFNPSEGMSVDIVTDGSDEMEALLAIERFLVCE
jgi:phosphocarrier protein